MLADLGVGSLRLLTNNPDKIKGLADFGLDVTGTVSLPVSATPHNLRYLIAKRDRLGHLIELNEPGEPVSAGNGSAGNGSAGDGSLATGQATGERDRRPDAEPVAAAGLTMAIVATRWNVVQAEVYEKDLGRIRIGQSAFIAVDTYPISLLKAK